MLRLCREARYIAGAGLLGALSGLILGWSGPEARPQADSRVRAGMPRGAGLLATAPLWFEENVGQADSAVRFLSRGRGFGFFLTPHEAVLSMPNASTTAGAAGGGSSVLRVSLAGSKGPAALRGEQPRQGKSHYFLGNDPSRWRPDVTQYSRVRHSTVYPGVDLVYYGAQGSLEFDFVVSPGADPGQIELRFAGQRSLTIDQAGHLVLDVGARPLRIERPQVYQDDGAHRTEIPAHYQRRGPDRVGFELAAAHDSTRPLIIDPVLNFSTFLGGSGDDQGVGIAVDAQGNTYVTGATRSGDFPTTPGAVQTRFVGSDGDVFVAKFDAIGAELLFSTFLGANQDDGGRGIAIGPDGSIYVAGETQSREFPITAGAWQAVSAPGRRDGFVAKLSADGSRLVYSSFLGGTDDDWATDVAVDSQGQAHVIGGTKSSEFPVTPLAAQVEFGGDTDAFLVKLRPDGSGPVFSTFLGGGSDDEGLAIALDPFRTIYATGYTKSGDFPVTAGAFQREKDSDEDAFVVKIFAPGAAFAYASFFGGNGADFGNDIAIDSAGSAFVTGFTRSNDLFRTTPVFQEQYNGGGDAFVVKVVESPRLQVQRMTYIGTSEEDTSSGIVVWDDGSVSIAGHTKAADFPVTGDAIQAEIGGGDGDAFVATLNPLFRDLVFSTFLGGDGRDEARSIALGAAGSLYVTGLTSSREFPATDGVYQRAKSDGQDVFVVEISETLTITSVSAASFDVNAPVAPNSIATTFGHDLAPGVEAASPPLPAELLGVRVNVIDSAGVSRAAALFFVSPRQISFLVPEGSASGIATVEVVRDGRVLARGPLTVRPVAPALFAINSTGQGVAAGFVLLQRSDGSRSTQTIYNPNQFPPNIEPIPVEIGTAVDQAVLLLFGTGIRGAGGAANVNVTIDGMVQQVLFAGDQMQYAGLDQVNVLLSPTLAGRGLLNLRLAAGGLNSNTVTIQVQ